MAETFIREEFAVRKLLVHSTICSPRMELASELVDSDELSIDESGNNTDLGLRTIATAPLLCARLLELITLPGDLGDLGDLPLPTLPDPVALPTTAAILLPKPLLNLNTTLISSSSPHPCSHRS